MRVKFILFIQKNVYRVQKRTGNIVHSHVCNTHKSRDTLLKLVKAKTLPVGSTTIRMRLQSIPFFLLPLFLNMIVVYLQGTFTWMIRRIKT